MDYKTNFISTPLNIGNSLTAFCVQHFLFVHHQNKIILSRHIFTLGGMHCVIVLECLWTTLESLNVLSAKLQNFLPPPSMLLTI
jgi:hypothetical protein